MRRSRNSARSKYCYDCVRPKGSSDADKLPWEKRYPMKFKNKFMKKSHCLWTESGIFKGKRNPAK